MRQASTKNDKMQRDAHNHHVTKIFASRALYRTPMG